MAMAETTETRPQADKSIANAARAAAEAPPSGGGVDIPIPVIGVRQIHVPAPSLPHMDLSASRLGNLPRAVQDKLPDRNQLIYYGGLGAMAAFGVVSWPVAAAISAGVWVAGRVRPGSAKGGA
jgi:hypothetical protein